MDKLRVINLKIPARHGVYDYEKDKDGLFELDLEILADLSKPSQTDNIEDTINYDDVISLTTKIFLKKDYNLIEAVGEDICQNLLNNFPIDTIKLKIRKPHAPIVASFDTVEVEIVRSK